ncbi:sperm-associated antigen 1 [Eupeodes corollae]|uniref:sperm-associated antigen 1 n=1 Tax=Eupeodes corollae TaxID=290404 RepID=UPI002491D9D2|nr:sperm-associated antigen 1 [Eupeodes corollae]
MEKRTFLQKYQIPINHLDFDYVKTCKNAKEMEQIVTILRSGEEGYFPDLTKCAEDKLRELKPHSRALRTEERVITKNSLSSKDLEEYNAPITEWSTDIKNKDSLLSKIQQGSQNDAVPELPPIRKGGKVTTKKEVSNANNNPEKKSRNTGQVKSSTNYNQWDKYDADSEILKMDLAEERNKEEVERKNRMNKNKKLEGATGAGESKSKIYEKLTKVEREKLAEDFRIRGNEFFKLKEYTNALEQYSRCTEILPSVAGYNNRAIANLKLLKYSDALADCNNCLQLDEKNLKAWFRKAEAYLGMDMRHDALRAYEMVKLIDPTNSIACKALEDLPKELGEVAPINATRLQITEIDNDSEEDSISEKSKPPLKVSTALYAQKAYSQQPKQTPKDYDLAELIKPNKVVKNSLMKTMENLGKVKSKALDPSDKKSYESPKKPMQLKNTTPDLKLRVETPNERSRLNGGGKMLIQEL